MGRDVVGRSAELAALHSLLERARSGPAVLILDGAPGIGKTTLCRAAAREAAAAGFALLTASGAAAEVSMSWAVLADVIEGIDNAALAGLSTLHQRALQAVAAAVEAAGLDERVLAAAFRAALARQSEQRPVLIVVDDAQWLDDASRMILGFAVRRLTGPIAVLAAFRSDAPESPDVSWALPADPDALARLTIGPISPPDIAALVEQRAGQIPPRQTMTRIHALSQGNPFYALELARALGDDPGAEVEELPPTLAALVQDRIGELDAAGAEVLITAAVGYEPTVDLLAQATGRTHAELLGILAPMENRGVLCVEGRLVRFTHPVIASGVITQAGPAARRQAHRRLADTVGDPEQRARHLALGTPHDDPDTLSALDRAAEKAGARGAHSSAAELIDMAIRRGGDNHLRRLRGAEFHFRAGDLDKSEALLAPIIDDLPAGFMRTAGLLLLAATRGYRDGVPLTIGLLDRAVAEAEGIPILRTQALLMLAMASGLSGDRAAGLEHARQARAEADSTGLAGLRSQALSVWVAENFLSGRGTDTDALRTALDLEDTDATTPVMFQASTINAMIHAWTGRLDLAHAAISEVVGRCEERGREVDLVWAAEQLTTVEVGLGRYDEARRTAEGALQRAQLIDGRLPLISAHTAIANAAARLGQLSEATAAANLAVKEALAAGLGYLARPPLMSLAFAQVSEGHYEAAVQTMRPLLDTFDAEHDTEIVAGGYLPDAVEALIATGRATEAEPLVAALQANGNRLDRPWMLAVGARCRALIQAASGDLDAALRIAEEALVHHERLPMPFEQARTELLLGQLQRRRRRARAALDALGRAAATFDRIGSPVWAARARREIARMGPRPQGATLTDAEQQVAERAVAGLTNKEIAAALYLSTKTVEMHLSSVYRKLGIRSRAQLAGRLREG